MPQTSYPYACARISALEKGLISESVFRRMVESSLDDVMRVLLDARYGNIPDAVPSDCERMIENEMKEAAKTIAEITPDSSLTDLILLQKDIHNLKVLIKSRMLSKTVSPVLEEGGLYSTEYLEKCVNEQTYSELPEQVSDALYRMEAQLRVHPEPQIVSIFLDYGYHAYCLEQSKKMKESQFATKYFSALCDFNNLLTFLRMRSMGSSKEDMKEMLLPAGGISREKLISAYELSADTFSRALSGSVATEEINAGLTEMVSTGNIGALEKARDNYLFSLVRNHRHEVLTFYPILGYYLAKDREAKAVRLILTAKRNGLDDAVITERLREMYE